MVARDWPFVAGQGDGDVGTERMQGGPFVRANALAGLSRYIASKGADPHELALRVGLEPRALVTPDMIVSSWQKGEFLELAARELDAPSAGLDWALNMPAHFPNAGPVLLLKDMTTSLGEWVRRSKRHWSFQTNAIIPDFIDDVEAGCLILRFVVKGTRPVLRQQIEHVAGKFVRLLQAVIGDENCRPLRVRFQHGKPDTAEIHERLFRCPVIFGADQNEIEFSRDILMNRIGGSTGAIEAAMDDMLRYRIGVLERYKPSVATSTSLAVKSTLGAGICSKEYIARALGTPPRTLQRLLSAEETSFDDILDGVRKELALEFLAGRSVPNATIAGILDFGSAAALTLAVKRWTGSTPSAFRATARARLSNELRGAKNHA